jgi:hypothetical protein
VGAEVRSRQHTGSQYRKKAASHFIRILVLKSCRINEAHKTFLNRKGFGHLDIYAKPATGQMIISRELVALMFNPPGVDTKALKDDGGSRDTHVALPAWMKVKADRKGFELTFPIWFLAHDQRGPFLVIFRDSLPAPPICKDSFPVRPGYSLEQGCFVGCLGSQRPFSPGCEDTASVVSGVPCIFDKFGVANQLTSGNTHGNHTVTGLLISQSLHEYQFAMHRC